MTLGITFTRLNNSLSLLLGRYVKVVASSPGNLLTRLFAFWIIWNNLHLWLKQEDSSIKLPWAPRLAQESVPDFFEALSSGWRPGDQLGAAAREMWNNMTWKGRQSGIRFANYVVNTSDTWLIERSCMSINRPRHMSVQLYIDRNG